MRLQRLCPLYEKYEFLYKHSVELQSALCSFYSTLVAFCSRMIIAFQRTGRVQFAQSFFSSFQSQFNALEKDLQTRSDEVEGWIRYASDHAADQERGALQRWRTSFKKLTRQDHDWKLSQDERRRSRDPFLED